MSESPHVAGVSDADLAAEARAVSKIRAVPVPPIDGDKFAMCGVDVTVPPLKVKHIAKFSASLVHLGKSAMDATPQEIVDVSVPIIHAALTRNYPTLTSDDVLELLDISIMEPVLKSVMSRSGFRAAKPGE